LEERGVEALAISAVAKDGVRELLYRAAQKLRELPPAEIEEPVPVITLNEEEPFTIGRTADGWQVSGARIEKIMAMSRLDSYEALQHLQRKLERIGLIEALTSAGVQAGDTVLIGDFEMEWQP